MIIQLHTSRGIIEANTDTVTDAELADFNMTREDLTALIPRDIVAEIDALKARIEKLEKK
jgi:hypothetical protein